MVENNKNGSINWNEVIKQEARGIGDVYLGKVQGLSEPDIVIERGTLNKEKFYIPNLLLTDLMGMFSI